ncbi:MAG: S-layer homology domain-containing protein [Clostridiales Family XIII bacterium]|nr:S-layer homology domain-containing protein [Clostridiales Family XIII bacterium]
MKKIVSWIAITAMAVALFVSGPVGPSYAAEDFPDISGHWAEGEIISATNYGYINGYVDGTFRPDNYISRAEFVKIINTAMYYTEMTNITYKDVPVNEWYFYEVQKAQKAGYIEGDDSGLFRPDAQISRQETAVILGRISQEGDTEFSLTGVRDASRISDWAMGGVRKAYSMGYMNGDTNMNFNPEAALRRGEAVKIINRVLGIQPADVVDNDQPSNNQSTSNNNQTNNNNTDNNATPSISSFNISSITQSQATMTVTVSKDSTAYWVLLEGDDAVTPNADRIVQGRTNSNSSAYKYSSKTMYANTSSSTTMSNLDSDQSYKLCLVARDSNGTYSSIATRTFTTNETGNTGQDWLGSYFTISNVDDTSATLTARSKQKGYVYWVLVEGSSSSTPTASRIYNGRDASNNYASDSGNFSVSANTSTTEDITGLTPGTSYRIYGCVFDSASSSANYSTVKYATIKTTGTNNQWISRISVASADIGETSASFTATFGVSGSTYKFYWMAVKSSNTAPTASQIRAGSYGTTASAESKNANIADVGDSSGVTLPSTKSLSYDVNYLTSGDSYVVYGVVYSGSGTSSYSNVVKSTTFKAGSSTAYASNLKAMSLTYENGGNTQTVASSKFSFAAATYTYNLSLPTGSTKLTLSATTDTLATARYSNNTFATFGSTGSVEIPLLQSGVTPIEITVRQDGRTDRIYKINVTVESAPVAEITNINIQDLQPAFTFKKDDKTYNHTVAQTTTNVPVRVTAGSGVTINVSSDGPTQPAPGSSAGSYTVELNGTTTSSGITVITISASKAGADSVEYKVTVTKP